MNWTRFGDQDPMPRQVVDVRLAGEFEADGNPRERRLEYRPAVIKENGSIAGARWTQPYETKQRVWERIHPDDKWRPTFVTHQPSRAAELEEARS